MFKIFSNIFLSLSADSDNANPALEIGDPELIKLILVKDFNVFHNRKSGSKIKHEIISKNLFDAEDQFWKRIRTLVTPTFTSGKMKKMY